ncbi:MAG: CopG family transcriptional regulator [Gammaproteobacteria bacterium]|nr:CopG family transcriptional regulator [Gammaproteobacteria bacterium]
MRVNARLDEETGRKLSYLKRAVGRPASEIIRSAIDAYYNQLLKRGAKSAELLTGTGFVGCGEGDIDLSVSYKGAWLNEQHRKHGHR